MKRLLRWVSGRSAGAAAEVVEPALRVEQVGELLRHFPIGARVHYYPEFQKTAKYDTLVLGYRVNDELFFSQESLRIQRAGGAARLFTQTLAGTAEVPRVDRLHFVVPFQQRRELDYAAAAEGGEARAMTEKVVNDFRRGNTITLFHKRGKGKVPHVDAEVTRVLDLREGVFANRRVVLLEPDPATFELLEQRHYHRVYTCIPAFLAQDLEGEKHGCTVLDFSERHLRLGVPAESPLRQSAREGSRLFLAVEFEHRGETVVLKGTAQRFTADGLVFAIQSIFKDRRFQNLDLIDELDLKTSLLHHPSTLRALHGGGEAPA